MRTLMMMVMTTQLWRSGRTPQERYTRVDKHPEGVAVRAHQEPLPDQGREDHASYHHQDDSDAGLDTIISYMIYLITCNRHKQYNQTRGVYSQKFVFGGINFLERNKT